MVGSVSSGSNPDVPMRKSSKLFDREEICSRWPNFSGLLAVAATKDRDTWLILEKLEEVIDEGMREHSGDTVELRRKMARLQFDSDFRTFANMCPTLSIVLGMQCVDQKVGGEVLDIVESCLVKILDIYNKR